VKLLSHPTGKDTFAMLTELIAQLPDLPSRDLGTDPKPFLVIFAVGFLTGIFGHIIKSKTLVAAGILMVFLATVGLPFVLSFNR
jgi:hypothetical protein